MSEIPEVTDGVFSYPVDAGPSEKPTVAEAKPELPEWALEAAAACWPEVDDEDAAWPDPVQVRRVAEAIFIEATTVRNYVALVRADEAQVEAGLISYHAGLQLGATDAELVRGVYSSMVARLPDHPHHPIGTDGR